MRLAIRLARQNLRSHKLRSRISTIGIVISVFLVSFILIISDSLKAGLRNQINQLSGSSIIVNGANNSELELLNLTTNLPSNTLDNRDAKYIRQATGDDIISNQFIRGTLSFDGRQLSNATTIATSMTDPSKLGLTMADGSWFDHDELTKKWVILGEDLANRLLGTDQVQSQVVDIKGEKFTVVGIIKNSSQPLSVLGYNTNQVAFISLSNGQSITDDDSLGQIIAMGDNDANETKRAITQLLGSNHADSGDYLVSTSQDISNRLVQLINYLTIIGCSLSVTTLLISCISIANIMMANIIERRREIGIRKAVGATTRNIMGQFLAESLIMSLRGGVVGIILAYAVAAVVLLFASISITFSWLALVIGFIVPIVVGVAAGVYPAYRASRQDIISALNQLT